MHVIYTVMVRIWIGFDCSKDTTARVCIIQKNIYRKHPPWRSNMLLRGGKIKKNYKAIQAIESRLQGELYINIQKFILIILLLWMMLM
jgi:hypothetical protein